MDELIIQGMKPAATLAIEYMRLVLPIVKAVGLSSRSMEDILSKDVFAEYEYNKTHPVSKLDNEHPTVGVIVFDQLDPSVARIIFGCLTPLWAAFTWLAVYYPTHSFGLNNTFVWKNPVNLIFWWGSIGAYGFTFVAFALSFIPLAAFRFIFFLAFCIQNAVGPWGGYWFAIAMHSFIYLMDTQKYFTTSYGYSVDHVFIHIFCLSGWTLLMLIFSIDFFDPLWKFY